MSKKSVFSQTLIALRKEKNLTQYSLAEKLGFSRGLIANYEQASREPDFKVLEQIANYFDVTTDYLLGRSKKKNISQDEHIEHDIFMSNISSRLSKILEEKNMTQRKLSELVGVSEVTISRYLNGNRIPKTDIISDIANALNVSVDYLLGRTNQSDKKSQQDHDNFMENVKIHFMDASEKDRDAIYRKISELYWDAKEKDSKSNL